MIIKETSWRITGNAGVTASVPVHPVVQVGAGYIRLPIANTKSGQSVMLQGYGVGAGVGPELPNLTGPVSVSGSLDEFPSTGLGPIYTGLASLNREYKENDFSGFLSVVSLGAGAMLKSGQFSTAFWTHEPLQECMQQSNCTTEDLITYFVKKAVPLTPRTAPFIFLSKTKAFGSFVGINATTNIGSVGADIYQYIVKS